MMKKYLFLILLLPLAILILLALPVKKSFRLTGKNILESINQRTHIISVQKFKEMNAGEQSLQIVDLRSVHVFADSHLPGALNLPAKSLSSDDIHRFFKEIKSTLVLYAEETYQAEIYWMLFTQMGIENIYVLDTGPVLDSLIMNWDSESSKRILLDEMPKFSFQPDTTLKF